VSLASLPPPSSRIDDRGSLALQVGELVGLAAVGALACTLPAALRVSSALAENEPFVRAWSALVAAALLPMLAAVAAIRGAWHAWRDVGEALSPLRVFGAGLWVAGLFVWMALSGAFLAATTHHHTLAGVTYAFGAVALAAFWGLVCRRIVAILEGLAQLGRRLAVASLGVPLLGAIAYIGVRFLVVTSKDPSSALAAATVIDVLAFALAALFGSVDWRLLRRPLGLMGPPLALFLGALGLATLGDPATLRGIREHAPVFVSMAALLPGH
jgi:hypothetical protein